MFTTNVCQAEGCTNAALSVIKGDHLISAPGFCLEHTADKEAATSAIAQYIASHDQIVGLQACGIRLQGIDLSAKRFYGCTFQHSSFANVHSNGLRLKLCVFDFSTFTDCDMINSNIQFCSFAGSKFIHAVLTGSDLIQSNYNGITAYQCSFDDSDLYNSRFIRAILMNTSMKNCNLKKTVFYNSAREHVSFKLSNTRESLIMRNQEAADLIDYPLPSGDEGGEEQ